MNVNGWTIITPEMAEEMLKKNICNYRSYDKAWAEALSRDMLAGNWLATGSPIVFSKNGVLQDGQHRLHAIVLSGVPVKMYVIYDADDTKLYDTNKRRNTRQILLASGYAATALTTGIASIILGNGSNTGRVPTKITTNYCENHFELIKKAESIVGGRNGITNKAACATIVYCVLRNNEMSETELRSFFKVVNTGNVIECESNPTSALVLRRQLMEISGTGHFVQEKQLEITYKALCDFHNGATRKNNYVFTTSNSKRLIKEVYDSDFQVIKKAG